MADIRPETIQGSNTLPSTAGNRIRFPILARVVKTVAVPLTFAVDKSVGLGRAVVKDVENGTTRNTVEAGASVAGGVSGGIRGGLAGAAIGTVILPGVGTVVGGVAGGVVGGIRGSMAADAMANTVGDALDYDIIEKTCDRCRKKFIIRLYLDNRDVCLCPQCIQSNDENLLINLIDL